MQSIVVYVPESHLREVKNAMFGAGAGKIGNYDRCSWQTKGEGQFRALEGAKPFVGEISETETVEEFRVEMVCEDTKVKEAIAAMKAAHPYETPAYLVLKSAT